MALKSLNRRKPKRISFVSSAMPQVLTFETELGWAGISHVGHIVLCVKIGSGARGEVLEKFDSPHEVVVQPNLFERELEESFTRYAAGAEIDFEELEIDRSWMTPFQRSVTDACRTIPRGETVSYGDLAEIAGAPRAARAVGSVMSNNPFPLIVPCHRVVKSGGGLGGFSAPDGTRLKIRLLQLEQAQGFCTSPDPA